MDIHEAIRKLGLTKLVSGDKSEVGEVCGIAISAMEKQIPKELTLDEILSIRNPIWIQNKDDEIGYWGYPLNRGVMMFGTSNIKSYQGYGNAWIAYTCPPEVTP